MQCMHRLPAPELHLRNRRLQQRAHSLHFMHDRQGHDRGGRSGERGYRVMAYGQGAEHVFRGLDQGVFQVMG